MDKQYIYCFKAAFIFLCIIYLPGLLYYPIFKEGYHAYYNYTGGLYLSFFVLFSTFSILLLLSFVFVSKLPYLRVSVFNPRFVSVIIFMVGGIYFILSIYFFVTFDSSFRHRNRLTSAGFAVTLLFMLKPIVYFLVSLMLIHILNGGCLGKRNRFLLLLLLISTVLFLNSSLQFVIIPLILIMLFSPNLLRVNLSNIKFKYFVFMLLLFPLVCVSAVFIGLGNKVGYSFLLSPEGHEYLQGIGNILFPRMSSSLFSSVIMLDNFLEGRLYSEQVMQGVYETLSNRLSLFFPTETFNSDLINTVNRLNYLEVFSNHADRAGASPGLLSSMFFTPFFPFSIFVIPLFVAFIFRALRYHMKNSIKMNLLSMASLTYLVMSLFESPLNIMYLIDPAAFLAISVVFLGRLIHLEDVFSK